MKVESADWIELGEAGEFGSGTRAGTTSLRVVWNSQSQIDEASL
jgi:hypothetical protein